MPESHLFANDAPILAFYEGLVIGTSGSALGEFDQQLVEQFHHDTVDVLAPVITVKSLDDKWILAEKILENGNEKALTDPLGTADDLPLSYLIDCIDMVDAFLATQAPLMNSVNAYVPG